MDAAWIFAKAACESLALSFKRRVKGSFERHLYSAFKIVGPAPKLVIFKVLVVLEFCRFCAEKYIDTIVNMCSRKWVDSATRLAVETLAAAKITDATWILDSFAASYSCYG